MTVPSNPQNVQATISENGVLIIFDEPVDNGGNAVIGYTVTSFPDNIVSKVPEGCLPQTAYPMLFKLDTDYTFTVVATNNDGDSLPSAPSNSIIFSSPATEKIVNH